MTPCGTVGYTAPEIVKDERYSKSVDMWALGCVLYTLLCGFPPFYDESIQVLTEKVARGQYTFLSPWWDDISKSAQDLVSHLLTVDPEKRFTIGQFLAHPWIRKVNEPTYAALDAPPLATPLAVRQKEWLGQSSDGGNVAQFLETPGGGTRRADFRSPGAVNLREVFDVGYAVHRQEEEAKRRKNFKQGYRGAVGPGQMGSLNALDEDDYDDEDDDDDDEDALPAHENEISSKVPKSHHQPSDVAGMEAKMRSTNLSGAGLPSSVAAQARTAAAGGAPNPAPARSQQHQERGGYGQHSPAVAAAAKQSAARKAKQPFELSLDNSTLLGRRNRAPGGGMQMQMQMPGQQQEKKSKLREEMVR
jgi:serine/threonine-protein kinase RCK2